MRVTEDPKWAEPHVSALGLQRLSTRWVAGKERLREHVMRISTRCESEGVACHFYGLLMTLRAFTAGR